MGKREENKEKKRRALERAALSHFAGRGYHLTSIEQIAADASVARGTFYLYFSGKDAVFQALVMRFVEPVLAALRKCSADLRDAATAADIRLAYLELAGKITTLILTHKDEALLFYRERHDPTEVGQWLQERVGEVESLAAELAQVMIDQGMLRDVDARLVALVVVGSVDRLIYAWMAGEELGNVMGVGEEVVRIFGEGLLTPEFE